VSYLNHDKTDPVIEKDHKLYDDLYKYSHFSPFEHCATPFSEQEYINRTTLYRDATHMKMKLGQVMYGGNFRGWTQYRKTLKNENYVCEA
jgi:hypothetical protein